ncbi:MULTISPECIES: DUF998 domain-containing protein [Micromonospora]|uniref:DUF998 domain-containing protein n=1 Tax=Micromonospora solifontis TaxID=2487138 RepID=A0ABX9WFZ1_9ACTN|nr:MULTISPECIES: DUF998 domain-containing protein [Micromonospora]NES16429.1 DUF998 domain-containing protein [Micromonospora sp. PPF5-17B]NES37218.1 DUF998 domain-containing protein [Micromonospora solifontis]NES57145.1 DUF998 domain-containing protein [Micromonospora sp. PPF5-6]RNL98569.1 DUF998 domain-containing protein [Micromonospora solifontis]
MTSTTITRAGTTEVVPTATLLTAGAAAGPLFLGLGLAQAFLRDGFDLSRQPLSLLTLGGYGWIQIGNFVLSGLLALAGAAGLRRALRGGPAGTWGPALVAVLGVGLIIAGVLRPDPSMGWPAGAPEGNPETMSWHSYGHGVGAMLSFGSLTVACLVLARRFLRRGARGWAVFSVLSALATVVVMAWPDQGSISVRLAVGSFFVFAWLTAVSLHTITERNN